MSDNSSIGAVADLLSFDLEPNELESCASVADDLAELASNLDLTEIETDPSTQTATVPDSEPAPGLNTVVAPDITASQSDDSYNALLAVYETPRQETQSGPLAGLSVAVKDNTAVSGLPMTCGDQGLNYIPSFDANVIERLLEAGASIVGKANMDAFAFGPSGEFSSVADVQNPVCPERIPGGSSSGSGAAVAANLVDVALGTDTGGSVRIPAACCGLVGIKPTTGRVPLDGIVPFAPSLDTVGPLSNDISTAAQVLEVLLLSEQRTEVDKSSVVQSEDSAGFKFIMPRIFFERSDDLVAEAVREVAMILDNQPDISVHSVDLDLDLDTIEDAYFLIGATEFAWWIRQRSVIRGHGTTYYEEWRRAFVSFIESSGFSDHVAKRVLPAAYLDTHEQGRTYAAGRQAAIVFTKRLSRVFDDGSLLLIPTIRTLPPEPGTVTANNRLLDLLGNTAIFNLAGTPAVSIPIAEIDGSPVSAQVIGPKFADKRTLAGAERVAAASDWTK